MNKKELDDFIHFSDWIHYLENEIEKEEWMPVYQIRESKKNGNTDDTCFYSCLVSEQKHSLNPYSKPWVKNLAEYEYLTFLDL